MEGTARDRSEHPVEPRPGDPVRRTVAGAGDYRRWLLIALLAAIALRVIGWIYLRNAFFCGLPGFEDAIHLGRIERLLQDGFPEAALPAGSPIYPYFGALVGMVTGGRIELLLLVQNLLGIAAIPLLGWALRPLLTPRQRGLAMLLYAIHPLFVFYELRLQPIAPALLILLLVLRLVFFCRHRSLPAAAVGGGVLGLGFLFIPLTFAALTVAAIWHWLRERASAAIPAADRIDEPPARPALGKAATLLGAALLLPILLCVNHAALPGGGPTWNWTDAHRLYRSLEPGTWGTARSQEIPVWQPPTQAQTLANEALGRRLDEWATASFYRGRGLQRLAEQPLRLIGHIGLRAAMVLSGPEAPDPVSPRFVLGHHAPALIWGLYLFPLYLGCALIGLWAWRRRPPAGLWPLLLALLAANLLGTYSAASRILLLVALLPAAAVGLSNLTRLLRSNTGRFVLLGIALLIGLSYLDLPGARRFEKPSEDTRHAAEILLRGADDRRGATALLRRALQEDPENFAAHTDFAQVLVREDLPTAARAEFERALALAPHYEPALFGLAEIYRAEGDYAQADSLLTVLVEEHPRHPLYLNQLATVLMMDSRFTHAREYLVRALQLDPQYDVARSNLRMVDETLRRSSALALPEDLMGRIEPEVLALGQKAVQALVARDLDRVDSLTTAALEQFPDNALALYMRAALLLRMGRAEESLTAVRKLLERFPGRSMLTEMAVQALVSLDRRDEARVLARENLAAAEDDDNRKRLEALVQQLEAN